MFSVGGGVEYLLRPHLLVRAEFRDYLTTFPRQQIVPAPHNTARGVFQQFTALFGLGHTFRTVEPARANRVPRIKV